MNDKITQFIKDFKNITLFVFTVILFTFIYSISNNFNPKILYYFTAYGFVYIINLFKLFIKSKIEKTPFNFYQTFLISTDIFFIAFGVIISQIIYLKNNDGQNSILLWSLMIFIFCIIFEFVESEGLKLFFNLKLILILLLATIYMTYDLKKSEFFNKIDGETISSKFEVCIPYKDLSISKHIGESKFNNKFLLYKKVVKANEKKDAKDSAIICFNKEVKALFSVNKKDTINLIEMNYEDIFVKD